MRILQINNCHYNRGGADILYLTTGKILEDRGHHVAYFSLKNGRNLNCKFEDYFVSAIDFRKVSFIRKIKGSSSYIYNQESYRKLSLLIKDFKPEVAHVHLYYGGLSISVLHALKKLNIPVIHTVHDYRLLCPVNTFLDNKNQICEKCKDRNYFHCVNKRCSEGVFFQSTIVAIEAYFWRFLLKPVKLIDHFIFVSQFARNKHIDFDSKYERKSSLLYNCPILDRSEISIIQGKYFLYLGRLSAEKGLNTLMEACVLCNVELVIAGTGPMKEEVTLFSKNHGNILYLGFQSGQTLKDLVSNSSFIIVPSEWYENNPMVIMEAFALGKPVIGADIGGIPEMVVDGETGFLFESRNSDSLRNVIRKASQLNNEEYLRLSNNVRWFFDKTTNIESHYNALLNIYKNVLKQ